MCPWSMIQKAATKCYFKSANYKVKAMSFLKQVLEDLNTPSHYNADWYGWTMHHIAHSTLGVLVAKGAADVAFVIHNEYPNKLTVTVICIAFFFGYQYLIQKDRRTDMLSDTLYFGAGVMMAFIGFTEVSAGSDHLDSNPLLFWIFCLVWGVSFIPGIARRVANKTATGTDL